MILKSESKTDDFIGIIRGLLGGGKFFKSYKVYYKNQGKLNISNMLLFGTFTNRNGLNPEGIGVFRIYKGGNVNINGNVKIARDCKIYVAGDLIIGSGTYINPNSMVFVRTKILIGENCAISWNCQIIDDDMHSILIDGEQVNTPKPIIIENHVWIGSGVKIFKGVTIGEGSIIAAGSIVTKSIPPHSLTAGIPARVIKDNIKWE